MGCVHLRLRDAGRIARELLAHDVAIQLKAAPHKKRWLGLGGDIH